MNRFATSAAILLLAATSAFAAGRPPASSIASTNPATVIAGAYVIEPSHTRVQFSVLHMGFTNWNGDFTGVSGSLNLNPNNVAASMLDISVPVASVSTTNAKLDGELKSADWLDAARFPTMHFVATKIIRAGNNKATITGSLTLHGVTRPVVLAAVFNGAGVNPMDKNYTVGFDATTKIRRSDFGIMTLVPVVGDETNIHISVAFEKTK
ncbi:YceI family protein [soil metagenome]